LWSWPAPGNCGQREVLARDVYAWADHERHQRAASDARERLWRAWKKSIAGGSLCHLVAFHADRSEDAEELCDRVRDAEVDADAHVVQVTSGLAAHTGPTLLGLAWWWEPLH
jgi:fatty acid-binding protein DegV